MALKKVLARADNRVKGDFQNSYWKISSIRNENGKINIDIKCYVDQDARKLDLGQSGPMMPGSGDITVSSKNFSFDEGQLPSPIYQTTSESSRLKHVCYLWLKNQDDFRNSVDVLEAGQNTEV